MRVSTILLTASMTVLASSNVVWGARIVDLAALSELTSPDLVQPMDAVQSKLNNRRYLRGQDTVDDASDLDDGLDEDADDEGRGFLPRGSELFAKIAANAAKLDDIEAKVAKLTNGKSLEQQFDAYLDVAKDNVRLFRKVEDQGYSPTSLAEKLATSRNEFGLDKKQAEALLAAFGDFWNTFPRRAKASD